MHAHSPQVLILRLAVVSRSISLCGAQGTANARAEHILSYPMTVFYDEPFYTLCVGSFDAVKDWDYLDVNNIMVVQNTADSVGYRQSKRIKYMRTSLKT